MLNITGPVVRKAQYDRIPMHDGLGAVSAFVHPTFIEYRAKGGSAAERRARVRMIAHEIGGTVATSSDGSYTTAWRPFE
jgi:hypothetical protein